MAGSGACVSGEPLTAALGACIPALSGFCAARAGYVNANRSFGPRGCICLGQGGSGRGRDSPQTSSGKVWVDQHNRNGIDGAGERLGDVSLSTPFADNYCALAHTGRWEERCTNSPNRPEIERSTYPPSLLNAISDQCAHVNVL